jgi:phage gp46-like protein
MSQDYKISQDEYGFFHLSISNGMFDTIDGFETALDVQVFTDKRTTKDDISTPIRRQGWMGDLLTNNFNIGSDIYLKQQSRNTQLDRNEFVAFVNNAMEYFVNIGAIKKSSTKLIGNNIEVDLVISNSEIQQYTRLWKNTKEF